MKIYKYLFIVFILTSLVSLNGMSALAKGVVKDSDHDGVSDDVDKCPNSTQYKMVAKDFRYAVTVRPERLGETARSWPVDKDGCELDSDQDGVVDGQDYCPEDSKLAISHGVSKNGCPKHSDADGTPDYRDHCPNTKKGVRTNALGCPKLEGDKKVSGVDIAKQIQQAFKRD